MTRLAGTTLDQSDIFTTQLDRCRDAVVRTLERRVWIARGGLATAILFQIALLAHTLTLTQ
jgi:hypothetical protein